MSAHCPREPQGQSIYTMYHGTSIASAHLIITNGFQQSSGGMLGPGVYVSRDLRKAARYPLNSPPSDRVVLELCVRVGRVKRIDQDNHPMQYAWRSHGYDTAWVPPNCGMKAVPKGLEEDCVFDPTRVQVVGIARAPNTYILTELQQLLSQKSTKSDGGGDGTRDPVVYTMYHGTSAANARLIIANGFKQSPKGFLGPGVYVTRDQLKAARYPLNSPPSDRVVLELRVRVGRVKRIDQDNHPMQYTWSSHGYDTAWVPPNCGMKAVPSGLEEDCVFDPTRVQVVGIARAPYTILTELQLLLSQKSTQYHGGGDGTRDPVVYTMYHGTSAANARLIIANGFKQSPKGMLGPGVYVARDQLKAARYPLNIQPSDRVVLELRVQVGRVKRIDQDNHPMQYTWSSQGYDTAWVPPNCGMKAVPSGLEEDCVFDPTRVQVVGIARAPYTILTELQQLLLQKIHKI